MFAVLRKNEFSSIQFNEWQLGACMKVHFHSPPFSQQDVLNCCIIKVSCVLFHVNFTLHLAKFITLLRLYVCLHYSCNLPLDFLCILILNKMLYWTHMRNISPWLGWKDRSKHFKQRHLTPVAESALDVWCVRQFFFFSSFLSIENSPTNIPESCVSSDLNQNLLSQK